VQMLPEVTLKELLLAFREALHRSEMFAHHHVQREALSVRQRMSEVLGVLLAAEYTDFATLFKPEEGRQGVVVTFLAVLELVKESLIEVVQAEPYAPVHVKAASASVADGATPA
jgi:segregation and condensation protein A